MQVFKAYFKVMRSSKQVLLINLGVFMALTVMFSATAPETDVQIFEPNKMGIAVINRDAGAPLAHELAMHLARIGDIVDLPDEREALQDALFFRRVEYIAIIPEGFSQEFMNGETPLIQKVIVPNSSSSFYVDMEINKFLNAAKLLRDYDKKHSEHEFAVQASADLQFQTKVTIEAFGSGNNPEANYAYYFRYCAYALLALMISGVGAVMFSFNQQDLYLRNRCTPLPKRKMDLQLLLGHGLFAITCWAFLILVAIVLYGQELLSTGLTGLYALNTFVFTIVCVSIGFVVGGAAQSYNALAGSVQVIALGLNFLGGVFVPQSIMSKPVLAVAKFLPSFWFVKNNDIITELGVLTSKTLRPVYSNFLIQLGFAVAIAAAGLLFRKERRVSQFA